MGWSGFFGEGKAYMEKGLRQASQLNDLMALGFLEVFYGIFYTAIEDWEATKIHFEKGIRYNEAAKSIIFIAWSWLLLETIYGKTDPLKIEKAEHFLLKGIGICEKLKTKPYHALGHLYLGEPCLNASDLEKAGESLKEAEGMFREMGWTIG